MKITKIFATASFFLVLGATQSYAQLALPSGEPDPSAILDLISKDRGMLMSRINLKSTTDALTIFNPSPTLLVYNTATSGDITPGFYYWNSHKWIRVLTDETPIEETLTTLISNGTGAYTYTNEKGTKSTINVADDVKKYETLTKLAYSPVNKSLSYIDEKGLSTLLDLSGLTNAMGGQGLTGATGPAGEKGLDGRGINNTTINSNGNLIVTYSDGTTKDTGIVKGPIGATGLQGIQGLTGATGPMGVKGLDGKSITNSTVDANGNLIITYSDGTTKNTGIVKGPIGATGLQGIQGLTGATGPMGVKGLDGKSITNSTVDANGNLIITYSDGTTKNTGFVKGATGATGSAGVAGPKGDTGSQGIAGVKGANGLDGKSITNSTVDANGNLIITYSDGTTKNTGFVKGATGADGLGGAVGPKGDTGSQGIAGVKGANGLDGKSITNSTVDTNGNLIITYSDGTTKNTGFVKGATGATGSAGVAGPKGDTGVQGVAGIQGIAGVKGTNGLDGKGITNSIVDANGNLIITYSDGTTKNSGFVKGATGANGAVGPKGDIGAQGIAGVKGSDGVKGLDGRGINSTTINSSGNLIVTYSDGIIRDTGLVKGAAGATGPKGDTGAQGMAGATGPAGIAPTIGAGTVAGKNLIAVSNGLNNAFKNSDISLTPGTNGQVIQTVNGSPSWVNLIGDNLGNHKATTILDMNTNIINYGWADGNKIQFLGDGTSARIEHVQGFNLKTVTGSKGNQIGDLTWANHSGAGKTETEVMRINTSNNLGVGTSNPQAKLDVNGNGSFNNEVRVDADSNADGSVRTGLVFGDGTSGEGITSNRIGSENKYGLDFWTGNTKRMSVTGNGNIGIDNVAPTNRLHIAGSINPLRLEGLQLGAGTDRLLSTDGNGVVRKLPMGGNGQTLATDGSGNLTWANAIGDNLGNHSATQNLEMNSKDINNINTATIKYNLLINDRLASNSKPFSLYKNNGTFGIWNSNKNSNSLVVNESTSNVGIGTDNPGAKLDVNGNGSFNNEIRVDADSNADGSVRTGLVFGDGTSGEGITSNRTGSENKYGLDFWTGNGKRMSVASNGNVGINTIAPDALFNVNKGSAHFTAGSKQIILQNQDSPNGPSEFLFKAGDTGYYMGTSVNSIGKEIFSIARINNLDPNYLYSNGTVTYSFIIDGSKNNNFAIGGGYYLNGVLQGADANYKLKVYGNIGATAFTQTSDKRFKKDITPITGALGMIKKVQGVGYNWRMDEFKEMNFNDKHQLGVIAQDIEKIVPEAVTKDEKGFYTVNYTTLVPVLVEAVKEQQKEIDSNEIKIKNLEKNQEVQQNELNELRAMIIKINTKK